jgi:hypothetical protein
MASDLNTRDLCEVLCRLITARMKAKGSIKKLRLVDDFEGPEFKHHRILWLRKHTEVQVDSRK